jgi:hypothetical protein
MRTIEEPTYSVSEFVGSEQTVGFDDLALAVYPLGLYGVQPRTLLGQQAADDPHSLAALFDFSVVRSEPPADLFGDVPARVVPDKQQNLLSRRLELLKAPRKEAGRYVTRWPPVDEAQPRLVEFGQVESVAGYGLQLGIVFGDRWRRRRSLPSWAQLFKVGKATRLHQHSSSKPMAHSGSDSATSIAGRAAFFLS